MPKGKILILLIVAHCDSPFTWHLTWRSLIWCINAEIFSYFMYQIIKLHMYATYDNYNNKWLQIVLFILQRSQTNLWMWIHLTLLMCHCHTFSLSSPSNPQPTQQNQSKQWIKTSARSKSFEKLVFPNIEERKLTAISRKDFPFR